MLTLWRWIGGTLSVALLAGCAGTPRSAASGESDPWAAASITAAPGVHIVSGWKQHAFPGKGLTGFRYVRHDGRDAMAAESVASASMMRRDLRVEPALLQGIDFSWAVPALIPGADMARREADDSPVRLVLAFEGDRSTFSARNAMLSELARALTGEEMPYATLMYVWSNEAAPGTVIVNPRTDRIRKIVVESGPAHLGPWRDYRRDIRADFQRAFGEPPGALLGVGIMTDSDNTASQARAWYGPIRLQTLTPN